MEAMVLQKACIQCGLCAGLCPEVFALDDGEPARVLVSPIPDEQKIGVQEAADSCPVAAIQPLYNGDFLWYHLKVRAKRA